jgi:hypothetical protein
MVKQLTITPWRPFLTLALDGKERPISRPGCSVPENQISKNTLHKRMGGLRTGVGATEMTEIDPRFLDRPILSPLALHTTSSDIWTDAYLQAVESVSVWSYFGDLMAVDTGTEARWRNLVDAGH